jgi:hypothetical protein
MTKLIEANIHNMMKKSADWRNVIGMALRSSRITVRELSSS